MNAETKKVSSKSVASEAMPKENVGKNVELRRNFTGSPSQTLKILSAVVTGMNANPNFPDMVPKYEDLVLAKSTLSNTLDESKRNRSSLAKQARVIAQNEAISLLETCSDYVSEKCGSDEVMAETSGFTLKKTTRAKVTPPPGKAVIKDIVKSAYANQIEIKVAPLGRNVGYWVYQSTDNQETWTLLGSFTNSQKIIVSNLTPREEYWYKVVGKTTGGFGPMSDSKNWLAPTS
jgi:hypothetical protein